MASTALIGQRFGCLLVIAAGGPTLYPSGKRKHERYIVRCDCGNEKLVFGTNLYRWKTRSCGCMIGAHISLARSAHGDCRGGKDAPEYTAWRGMRQRCEDPKHKSFADYGGRGIKVCARWGRYENFLADMGRRPSSRHSLERENVNGDYEPDNCIWATPKQQADNRRPQKPYRRRGPLGTYHMVRPSQERRR